jgi:hypothetical protein
MILNFMASILSFSRKQMNGLYGFVLEERKRDELIE